MNCQGEICINLCNVRGNSGGGRPADCQEEGGAGSTSSSAALMAGGGERVENW